MSDCNGEDLLRVFKELNISLRDLNPNVVKAWFDTDDRNMKNLLTWMCTSLSKENYLSPLEKEEFLELEAPLTGQRYERELEKIAEEYPDIFDVDTLALEIELLEDEIELAAEEEKHLDELIKINETLENNLSKELDAETSEEIKTALQLKSTQELCSSLGEKLDEVNEKLHKQLVKYGSNLYDFEFGSVPNFINNMELTECQENCDNITSFVIPLLEGEFFPGDSSITATDYQTCSDSLKTNDSIMGPLITMKNRILHSHQNYVVTKIEVEKAREVLNYLNKTDINTIMCLKENAFAQMNREGKEETKRRMCGMLDNISTKLAEHHIAQTKFKYAQEELQLYQAKYDSLKTIEDTILKFLSQYFMLSILYIHEKKDIDNSDQFFRKILQYIREDVQSCAVRTEKMNKITYEKEDYDMNMGGRFNMIKSIVKMLTNEQHFDLQTCFEAVGEFKTELDRLENKLFLDFYDHKKMVKDMRNNVDILQKFLTCGPTNRIILVPSELQQVLRLVDDHLKKQAVSVKSAIKIGSTMKKVPNKWQNYRRQLWMYFYADQKKLFQVLQEVEEESKKQRSTAFRNE